MLAILGPAKTIDTSPHGVTEVFTMPQYLEEARALVELLRTYSLSRLKTLMKVSDKLATLTFERYAAWRSTYGPDQGQQACWRSRGRYLTG
jgi:cytoplasmic iron level regulating protein YaaA (DUF328/UPF0246 family)